MKLIEPKVEIIQQEPNLEGIYKQIEQAARICYKSEDKITDTSAKEFVDRLIKNKHLAMLEHGTVYLHLPEAIGDDCDIVKKYKINTYSYIASFQKTYNPNIWLNNYVVTTNLRVLQENNWLDDLQYLCEPTEYHEKRYTLKFITSIGITRELIRHRRFSFANESSRFCRYKNGLTFIKPYWFVLPAGEVFWHDGICYRIYDDKNNPDKYISVMPSVVGEEFVHKAHTFLHSIDNAETSYLALLLEGLTAQQAREVLPLCTKSELVMTGFESDWKEFFDKRLKGTTGKPHPDMIHLCKLAQEELTKNGIVL